MRGKTRGFTLIELMITVAVVGLLTAIAYPSYQSYVVKANRSAAQQYMLRIANMEEEYLLANRSYTATIGAGGLGLSTPAEVSGKYTLAISNVSSTPPSYTITATPVVGGSQVSDGNLTLDHTGSKGPSGKW